jgi:hypothetical protein
MVSATAAPQLGTKKLRDLVNLLGTGLVRPVAYDTAWVARVPAVDDPAQPAFPETLQWLREHQLNDGSWGTAYPRYAHGNTLSTLAAILALAQWGQMQDCGRIERGVEALWSLAEHLPHERYESIGFELLLPTLQDQASAHGLRIPNGAYQRYAGLSEMKQRLIAKHKGDPFKPRPWWFSFEAVGGLTELVIQSEAIFPWERLLTPVGSVGLSPAATACLLQLVRLHGADLPQAQQYLGELIRQNNFGVPHVAPLDGMELAFGIDFLLKGGIDATDPVLASAVELQASRFDAKDGFGYSTYFIPDADETAIALRNLYLAGYRVNPEPLMRFYNGSHMLTYLDERNTSVSCNIHALNALKLFTGDSAIDSAISNILTWLTTQAHPDGPVFDDKWHLSPFYTTSRAVFALEGLNEALARHCIEWILDQQQADGGWGAYDTSTPEETAHVCLALCFWKRCGSYVPQEALTRSAAYLSTCSAEWPRDELWIGKTLYCPTITAAAAIAAARHALYVQIQ